MALNSAKNRPAPKKQSLKANILFNAIYQILVLVIPFITAPYVSRTLLPSGVGSYSYAYSYITYFTAATYCFLDYATVTIAKHRDDKEEYSRIFWEILTCKLMVCLVTVGIYFGLVLGNVFSSTSYPLNTKMVLMVMSLDIFAVGIDITFLFQGLEHFVSLCARNLVVKILNLVGIFVFVRTSQDYGAYVWVMSLSLFLTGFSTLLAIPKYVAKPKLHRFQPFHYFKSAFVYFLPYVASIAYTTFSKTILGVIGADSAQSGYYESAEKLVSIAVTLVNSLNTVMMSRMAYLYQTGNEAEIRDKTKKVLEVYFLAALPCFFGILAINPYFTVAFFGQAYEGAIPLVYWLSPRILLIPISGILGSIYYIPSGHLWKRTIFLLSGTVFSLAVSPLMTKYLGSVGTAATATMTELLVSSLYFFFAKKTLPLAEVREPALQSFDAALLMYVLLYGLGKVLSGHLGNLWLSVLLVLCGILIYGVTLLLFHEPMVTQYYKKFLGKLVKHIG